MLDLVVIDGTARGIVTRNLVSGEIERFAADAVLLATGGYGNLYYLSTNAGNSNVTAAWRCARRGAYFANPCFVQIHPTCIPASGEYQSKLTLMSESLRNDGRVWVPKQAGDRRAPQDIPERERYYFLEERYPSFGNLVPRDVAARGCKTVCDEGQGVGPTGYAVYLDFADAIRHFGAPVIRERYGNLFQMYERIVGDDPYQAPMRIYPAVHYTMGGLWVDYNLMSNIPGLFVLGEANFSDHGANRLGASALMQGLADGYFIIPYALANYIAGATLGPVSTEHDRFKEAASAVQARIDQVLGVVGDTTVTAHHRRLGQIMWEKCSISRTQAGMEQARAAVRTQREEFWQNVRVPGEQSNLNKSLELALRVADFLEFGELVATDALARDESCGCHFREEHQTPDGEAKRDDQRFAHVAAWEWHGEQRPPTLHQEPLHFESVELTQRNYR
jgi:succinate dehydrogenase / fumarate reductase flavoprotein subunit